MEDVQSREVDEDDLEVPEVCVELAHAILAEESEEI